MTKLVPFLENNVKEVLEKIKDEKILCAVYMQLFRIFPVLPEKMTTPKKEIRIEEYLKLKQNDLEREITLEKVNSLSRMLRG